MKRLAITESKYVTNQEATSFFSRLAPSLIFYVRFVWIVLKGSFKAKRGKYDGNDWSESSLEVLQSLESAGMRFSFSGFENIENIEGPCVLIGNHMSILETLILPCIVQPIKRVTFVVKDSLLNYPVFKHIMRSRDPIAVTRTQPREDLKAVMNHGGEKLKNNISIIVFPQTTRSYVFDQKQFSSIGVKLAKKAGVPVVPIALKTDALQNGTYLKDFGKLNLTKTVHIAFGKPLTIEGKGTEEHHLVIEFIEEKLKEWGSGETGRSF
jgi:1-acyl-sn-glycerol-3-phosphate acyltransferase